MDFKKLMASILTITITIFSTQSAFAAERKKIPLNPIEDVIVMGYFDVADMIQCGQRDTANRLRRATLDGLADLSRYSDFKIDESNFDQKVALWIEVNVSFEPTAEHCLSKASQIWDSLGYRLKEAWRFNARHHGRVANLPRGQL